MISIKEDEVQDANSRSAELAPSGDRAGVARRGPVEGGRRRAVLLVEDSDADRDLYGGLLWYNGFDVFYAEDGESAVSRALELRPDLILLDIGLPGALSGLDVARQLRASELGSRVVFLSAYSRDELDPADVGDMPYLEKPIDPFTVMKEVVRRIGYARSEGS